MKTVRVENNVVIEIIPEYALPVEKWYGSNFSKSCMEAPDEVEQRWLYDPDTDMFSPPESQELTINPTDTEVLNTLLGVF